ncbi:MAG TPA: hypothetical protein VI958_02330, partial [Acidobacteriota bacterium]
MIFQSITGIWEKADLDRIVEAFAAGKSVQTIGIKGSARSFYLDQLQRHLNMPLVVICSSTKRAEDTMTDLHFLSATTGLDSIVYFPTYDTEPYQGTSPHPQVSSLRMKALWQLRQGRCRILVVPAQAAARYLPPVENLERSVFAIEWGDERDPVATAA